MAIDSTSQPAEVLGRIDDITDGLVRVLVGDADEEWFYPVEMLHDDAAVGDEVELELIGGRYQPVEVDESAALGSIDRRLRRGISARRTAQIDAATLKRSIAEG